MSWLDLGDDATQEAVAEFASPYSHTTVGMHSQESLQGWGYIVF
jgi:hypothetical protein